MKLAARLASVRDISFLPVGTIALALGFEGRGAERIVRPLPGAADHPAFARAIGLDRSAQFSGVEALDESLSDVMASEGIDRDATADVQGNGAKACFLQDVGLLR